MPLYREFAQLDAGMTRLPDESTILRFRHFLEAHQIGLQKAQHPDVRWHVTMRPGQRRLLDRDEVGTQLLEQVEQIKARNRAKVEHPVRVIKQQFGYAKTRYRGLMKNTQPIVLLFLWQVR